MKKKLVMMLVVVLVSVGACSSRPKVATDSSVESETDSSDKDESRNNQTNQDEDGSSTDGKNPRLADVDEAEVKELIESQLKTNAAGLEDYLENTPFATAMTGQLCTGDEDPVYIDGFLADEPVLNRWISDPIVGDQRNFLFIIKADAKKPEDLSLDHLKRDDTRIEYTLEVGETYQLIVYLQNNVRYDEKNPDAGAIENLGLAASVPLTLDPGAESRLVTIIGGDNTTLMPSCEIALTAEAKAKLVWSNNPVAYGVDGQYATLGQSAKAHYTEKDGSSATIDMLVTSHYSASSAAFLGFNFTVEAE